MDDRGDRVSIPVVFPDGARLNLIYPEDLELADMGLQPDVDLVWDRRWLGAIVFSHGAAERRILAGDGPVRVHTSADGTEVEEWAARPSDGRLQNTTRWLVHRLEDWTVHVPLDEDAPAEEVVTAVSPVQTGDGFVVLEVDLPARLPEGFGAAGGPQVALGDADPRPDFVRTVHPAVLIQMALTDCDGAGRLELQGDYGRTCLGDGQVFVNAHAAFNESSVNRRFVARVIEDIEVTDLQPTG